METNSSFNNGLPANRRLLLDLRLVTAALFVLLVVALFMWKPWSGSAADSRTVAVTGEATVTAKPDEFIFYPTYQFRNANKDTALAELTKKSGELIAGLKALGISENKIKTNSDGNDYPILYLEDAKTPVYTLRLTVTANSQQQAQKVSDYLVTTTPLGSVSPQASFSENKRKELENQARDEATKDARSKVDKMAKNLGFKIGKVKTITDDTGFNTMPYAGGREIAVDAKNSTGTSPTQPTLGVQPGENDLRYSVKVTYFIR
jgi:uncharacterized protein